MCAFYLRHPSAWSIQSSFLSYMIGFWGNILLLADSVTNWNIFLDKLSQKSAKSDRFPPFNSVEWNFNNKRENKRTNCRIIFNVEWMQSIFFQFQIWLECCFYFVFVLFLFCFALIAKHPTHSIERSNETWNMNIHTYICA